MNAGELPRVFFQFGNLRWDCTHILFAVKGAWRKQIIEKYPELEKLPDDEKAIDRIKEVLIKEYRVNFDKIADSVIRFQKAWDAKNNEFMRVLSRVLEVNPPSNKVINAYVGVNPISPRNWRNWSFCLHFSNPEENAVRITAHEVTHFFYFKKLREEFPSIDTDTFNKPHEEWVLSEILAPVILNDPRIVSVIGESKMKTYVCDDKTLREFDEMYKKHLEEGTSFVDFYEKAKSKLMLFD